MSDPFVKSQAERGIAFITFFHPKSNALPADILRRLADTILTQAARADVHVLVVQSGGEGAFCAGASFQELLQIKNEREGQAFFSGFALVINAIRTCGKLVIGRVQGKTVGGGVGLMAASDYCLGHAAASVRLSELNIGIGPFVIEPAISRKTGIGRFTELTMHPDRFFDADWLCSAGLVQEIYPDLAELDAAVEKLALRLAAMNPEALSHLKTVLWEGTSHWSQLLPERAALSGRLVLSEFTKAALAAYK